jgi:putative glutamine amidotransferase
LLGLCRGIQIFNVALGGTLYQDVGAERVGSIKHDYFPSQGFARDHLAHDVIVEAGTRTESALGSPRVAVNSMHHQAIRELAAGLVATAHAPDGVIEAVESSSDHWMVGVQWHPESLEGRDERAADLFRDFVAAAAKYGAAHEANR